MKILSIGIIQYVLIILSLLIKTYLSTNNSPEANLEDQNNLTFEEHSNKIIPKNSTNSEINNNTELDKSVLDNNNGNNKSNEDNKTEEIRILDDQISNSNTNSTKSENQNEKISKELEEINEVNVEIDDEQLENEINQLEDSYLDEEEEQLREMLEYNTTLFDELLENHENEQHSEKEKYKRQHYKQQVDKEAGNEIILENEEDEAITNESQLQAEEQEEGISDFEQELNDFDPHDILTVVIHKNQEHRFYLNITELCPIKASYFVVDDEETIDYKIKLPNKRLFHEIESENHDYVNFNATEKGLYTFILINNRAKDTLKVTFAVHAGLNMDKYFNKQHLSTIRGEFIKAKHLSKQLEGTKKTWNMKFSKHLLKANTHNRSILIFSLVESAVLILIFYFQLRYVLNLVEKI